MPEELTYVSFYHKLSLGLGTEEYLRYLPVVPDDKRIVLYPLYLPLCFFPVKEAAWFLFINGWIAVATRVDNVFVRIL